MNFLYKRLFLLHQTINQVQFLSMKQRSYTNCPFLVTFTVMNHQVSEMIPLGQVKTETTLLVLSSLGVILK